MLLERSCFDAPRIGEIVDERLFGWLASALRIDSPVLNEVGAGNAVFRVRWGESLADAVNPSSKRCLRINRAALDRGLFQHAAARGVTAWQGVSVIDAARVSGGWKFTVRNGDNHYEVKARFAVEATGRTSYAKFSSRGRIVTDRSVACAWRCPDPSDAADSEVVYLESAEDGWWYASRLPTGERLVVFVTDSDVLPNNALERSRWLHQRWMATETIPAVDGVGRAPTGDAPLAWRRHDARMSLRKQCSGDGWLCIGDAQMSLDPLTGMGMAEAARSALFAVPYIESALRGDRFAHRDFAQAVAARYNRQLLERRHYYDLERRWPDAPFWSRRHSARLQTAL